MKRKQCGECGATPAKFDCARFESDKLCQSCHYRQKHPFLSGWTISHNPKPVGTTAWDWDFSHENYDGENGLCGTASSYEDAIEQIREIGDE
jgi:hypothetical protein